MLFPKSPALSGAFLLDEAGNFIQILMNRFFL